MIHTFSHSFELAHASGTASIVGARSELRSWSQALCCHGKDFGHFRWQTGPCRGVSGNSWPLNTTCTLRRYSQTLWSDVQRYKGTDGNHCWCRNRHSAACGRLQLRVWYYHDCDWLAVQCASLKKSTPPLSLPFFSLHPFFNSLSNCPW